MLSHAMQVVCKNKIVTKILEFLFFKAANIVGQRRKACFALVLEKHTRTEENFVFPYLNTSFKNIENFYQQLFMEVAIITSRLLVIYGASISLPFPQMLYVTDIPALSQSSCSQPFHSCEVSSAFLRWEKHLTFPKSNIFFFLWLYELV